MFLLFLEFLMILFFLIFGVGEFLVVGGGGVLDFFNVGVELSSVIVFYVGISFLMFLSVFYVVLFYFML